MLLDRLWPAGPRQALDVTTEGIRTTRDMLAVQTMVTDSVLTGETSGREGARVTRLLQEHLEVLDKADIEECFDLYLREKLEVKR